MVAACSTRSSLPDGTFGAYYAVPDNSGWNDEVWLEIRRGRIETLQHSRHSAFGDIISSELSPALIDSENDRNNHELAELLTKTIETAESGISGFFPVERTTTFQQESF